MITQKENFNWTDNLVFNFFLYILVWFHEENCRMNIGWNLHMFSLVWFYTLFMLWSTFCLRLWNNHFSPSYSFMNILLCFQILGGYFKSNAFEPSIIPSTWAFKWSIPIAFSKFCTSLAVCRTRLMKANAFKIERTEVVFG